jgi:hypothetical protein
MDAHLKQALDAIEQATVNLTAEQIGRPVPGKWSVAEILDHLRLAFEANARALERVTESGQPRARRPRAVEWLARTCVIDIGYFPRARAPEQTTPGKSVPPGQIVDAARQALVAVDAALTKAAARFGEHTPIVNHPYFAQLTVHQWRKFHWRHTAHHMKQVRERTQG